MKCPDGAKMELAIREIYDILEKHRVTPNEAAAIGGQLISVASINFVIDYFESTKQPKGQNDRANGR